MLALESDRWSQLNASSGIGNGNFAAELLRQIRAGQTEPYDELGHQICHQMSVGEVAYAVVPHLVDLATNAAPANRLKPLSLVGYVIASRACLLSQAPEIPEGLLADYEAAVTHALPLALESLRKTSWSPYDANHLIATVSALHGRADVAMQLFLSSPDLTCPECGEYIRFTE